MVDRTDIDALLISALYGELTPADEARLTAHLESHPADRTALADLTQTRAAVRESRILSVQLEPPQSISAMLLREAARRAPRVASEDAGWFQRFTRSFMAHPAMAAAAMLVLVVGVAGTLYVRRGDLYAPPVSESAVAQRASDATPTGTMRSTPALETPVGTAAPAAAAPAPAAPAAPASETAELGRYAQAAGSGSYGVGLSEGDSADSKAKVAVARAQTTSDGFALDTNRKELSAGKDVGTGTRGGMPADTKPSPVAAYKVGKKGGGIEVLRSRELAPKDLDDEQQDFAKSSAGRIDNAAVAKQERVDRAAPGNAGPSGGGATPAPVTVPVTPSQDQPADMLAQDSAAASPSKLKAPAPAKTVAHGAVGSSNQAPQSPAAQTAPPPPPASVAPPSDSAAASRDNRRAAADKAPAADPKADKAEEKSADDSLISWASQQHRQVVALVGSNKCREAASAAVAIYNRAPDYYAANVATDRSIKPCLAYVTTERERVDRTRAASKRANAADAPAASPPARK